MEKIVLAVALSFTLCFAAAQEIKEPKTTAEWTATYQPFRIAGNLYYVGTYDLACYLITTTQGNILINTGFISNGGKNCPSGKCGIPSLLPLTPINFST